MLFQFNFFFQICCIIVVVIVYIVVGMFSTMIWIFDWTLLCYTFWFIFCCIYLKIIHVIYCVKDLVMHSVVTIISKPYLNLVWIMIELCSWLNNIRLMFELSSNCAQTLFRHDFILYFDSIRIPFDEGLNLAQILFWPFEQGSNLVKTFLGYGLNFIWILIKLMLFNTDFKYVVSDQNWGILVWNWLSDIFP